MIGETIKLTELAAGMYLNGKLITVVEQGPVWINVYFADNSKQTFRRCEQSTVYVTFNTVEAW